MVGGLPTSTVNGFAVDTTNPSVMYVALREGVFRTDDAGQRWEPVTGGPRNAAAVAVHPKRPAEVYAATSEGAVWVSTNGGVRWAPRR
ncbi:MAG: hypothetical protein HY727_20000 [Candidatus Rokubacteria bacterium]|nr:hypothetical protein [Candidatus Rokubacteria bacterium]